MRHVDVILLRVDPVEGGAVADREVLAPLTSSPPTATATLDRSEETLL